MKKTSIALIALLLGIGHAAHAQNIPPNPLGIQTTYDPSMSYCKYIIERKDYGTLTLEYVMSKHSAIVGTKSNIASEIHSDDQVYYISPRKHSKITSPTLFDVNDIVTHNTPDPLLEIILVNMAQICRNHYQL